MKLRIGIGPALNNNRGGINPFWPYATLSGAMPSLVLDFTAGNYGADVGAGNAFDPFTAFYATGDGMLPSLVLDFERAVYGADVGASFEKYQSPDGTAPTLLLDFTEAQYGRIPDVV